MTTETAPRRDIKELTAIVDGLDAGDLVTATFSTPRYGTFTISGVTVLTLNKKNLVLGSWVINSEGKPAKGLQTLVIEAKAGDHDQAIVPGSRASTDLGSN